MHKMLCADKIFLPTHSGQECFSAQTQAFHDDNIFLALKWPPRAPILRIFAMRSKLPENQSIVNNSRDEAVTRSKMGQMGRVIHKI